MNARTGSLPHDLAGSLSPAQFKKWLEERARELKNAEPDRETKV